LEGWLKNVEKTTEEANNFTQSFVQTTAVVATEAIQTRDLPDKRMWKGKDVGHLYPLLEVMSRNGIDFTVTSGYRPGSKTASNKRSWHSLGMAVDIKPAGTETWESLKRKIVSTPEVLNYFKENKLGIYDETTREVLAKTGGSGLHFHIGPDNVAILGLQEIEREYRNDILKKESSDEYPDWFGGVSFATFDTYREIGTGNQQIPFK